MKSLGFFNVEGLRKTAPVLLPRCGFCQLYKKCISPKMPVSGKGLKEILIVGEAPGKNEDEQNRQFVGKTGKLLQDTLWSLGVDLRQDCWITNSLICRPPSNKIPDKRMVEWCRPNLINTIKELKPKLILLLGAIPVRSLIGWLWKEDPGGINRWAGYQIPSRRLNAWVVPAWHPSFVSRIKDDPKEKNRDGGVAELVWKRHLKAAFAKKNRPWNEADPDISSAVRIELNPNKAATAIQELMESGKPLAFDIETNGIKPDAACMRIFCCSVSDGETSLAYPWYGEAIEATKELITSKVPKIGYNCFSGGTKFLTREYGVVKLSRMCDRTVTVLNHEGRWVSGKVRSFGLQETIEVTFARRNHTLTVRATDDHEWITVLNGSRIRTRELKKHRWGAGKGKADGVPYLRAEKVIENHEEYLEGVRHGIVYGDGTRIKKKAGEFRIRLCGEKTELSRFFDEFTVTKPPCLNGDLLVYVRGQDKNLKELPDGDSSDSYLIGFFRGLLATDGTINGKGQTSLTNKYEATRWCKKYLPRVGFWFQCEVKLGKYAGMYSGGYGSTQDSRTIFLSRESVTPEDLLRKAHRNKWFKVELGPFRFSKFGRRRIEEVYCVTVDDGSSFTLNGGIVTGNCKYEARWMRKHLGVWVKNTIWDGMLAAHVLDNRPGTKSLKFQAFALLGEESYDDSVKPYFKSAGTNEPNRIAEVPLPNLLKYCALDSLLEVRVARIQAKKLGVEL